MISQDCGYFSCGALYVFNLSPLVSYPCLFLHPHFPSGPTRHLSRSWQSYITSNTFLLCLSSTFCPSFQHLQLSHSITSLQYRLTFSLSSHTRSQFVSAVRVFSSLRPKPLPSVCMPLLYTLPISSLFNSRPYMHDTRPISLYAIHLPPFLICHTSVTFPVAAIYSCVCSLYI